MIIILLLDTKIDKIYRETEFKKVLLMSLLMTNSKEIIFDLIIRLFLI